jgi:hypothetical protein
MSHSCISNPCTICYPSLNKVNQVYTFTNLASNLTELLVWIFEEGLDEDAFYRFHEEFSLKELQLALQAAPVGSLEARLLEKLVEDVTIKNRK